MNKAFVTGGTGFIGSILIEELFKKNFEVFALVRDKKKLKWLNGINCNFIEGTLKNLPQLPDVDYVFHLAGVVRAVSSKTYYEVNTEGTIFLFEKAKQIKNLKKFIFVSSQAASGPGRNKKEEDPSIPVSHYGLSKLLAEDYVKKEKEIPWVILKPAAVYGPRDRDVYEFFKMIKEGFFLTPSGGERFLNLVYVYDLVEAIIEAALNENAKFKEYFIAYPEVISWKEFAEVVAEEMNKKIIKIKIPIFIVKFFAFLNDLISFITGKPAKLNSDKVKEIIPEYWTVNSEKFIKDTNFQYKFDKIKGIRKTLNWYRENNWL